MGKLLVAAVELAGERLGGCMHDLVSSDIAVLCERLAADVAVIWSLSSVSSFVSLEVADLREPLIAARNGARLLLLIGRSKLDECEGQR